MRDEALDRKQNAKKVRLQKHRANVEMGPHRRGSPITAKEKICILNLYQSFLNDGMNEFEAIQETARRLQFGIKSVQSAINPIGPGRFFDACVPGGGLFLTPLENGLFTQKMRHSVSRDEI